MSGIKSSAQLIERKHFGIFSMIEHDLLEVVEIEEESGLSRWGWDAYHSELTQGGGTLMFVARRLDTDDFQPRQLAGFIAARIVSDELHVNNVAVRNENRRQGIGKALLETALNEAARSGARIAFLEVRASNMAAQALYARCGFRVAGRRKHYYSDPTEDALLMSRKILK